MTATTFFRCVAVGALALVASIAAAQDAPPPDAHAAQHHGSAGVAPSPAAVTKTGEQRAAGKRGEPNDHVAPPPPQNPMHDMSAAQMIETMQMDDRAPYSTLWFDRLERAVDAPDRAWNLRASLGGDSDRVAFRSEGERERAGSDADAELLWSHAVAPFWDGLVGVRHDFGDGSDRTWVAFGVQGLAPYWFDVAATAYLGEGGRTALRVEAAYEMRLTQRLILEPRVEANAYGRADLATRVGAGLSDAEAGLRLRYELRREFAPYVGVERRRLFGATADFARIDGTAPVQTRWVVGMRMGF